MTDTRVQAQDKSPEKGHAGDTGAGLTPDGPPKTTQQIAASWDAAFNSHNFTAVNAEMKVAAQSAYEAGGSTALGKLQTTLNDQIKAPGAGPVFVVNGGKIEIHNMQGYSDAERSKLAPGDQNKLTTIHSVGGDYANAKEISDVATIDKPQSQGIKLKPGQKLSDEFPGEYTVATALRAGGLLNKDWMANNPEQRYLVDKLPQAGSELGAIPPGVLDGVAQTGGVDKVNKFLADKGMDIRLDPVSNKSDVAMAAVLSLKGAWAGKDTTMTIDGKDYPAAQISHVRTFKQNGTDVVQLYQKDGVTVYAAPMGDDKLTSFQVTQKAADLTPTANTAEGNATKVLMPKVDKNVSTDLVGLKGLQATDGTNITQAKMQTKLAIDQNGFSAEQGVALAATRGIDMAQPIRLDKPFIVWATADGVSQPLFATAVDQKYWKDPKAAK